MTRFSYSQYFMIFDKIISLIYNYYEVINLKITHLYLKNFAHIFSGLGKYEIDLDFTESDKVINIIVGKMGTCKTVILGSLQPFQSFGTLDVRNQDSLILPNEDGQKIIEYADGPNVYKITHNYAWNKTTHNVKSYIERNGEELNPNGNQSSFKDIIEREFGIEQNFLRLLRLGSNVSNVINMKSTERKTFIASLLKDAEVYSILYKKLNDNMKELNAKASILSNKLNHISSSSPDELNKEYESNKDKIANLKDEYDSLSIRIYEIQGTISAILQNCTYDEYVEEYNNQSDKYSAIKSEIEGLSNTIHKYDDCESITSVSKAIGSLDAFISQINKTIAETEDHYKECTVELSKYVDTKKMIGDEEKLDGLKEHYADLMQQVDNAHSEIKGFNSPYSASQITRLIGELTEIDLLIDDTTQYDKA